MGTPEFAVPCLAALIDSKHEVCAVFTQPDKPKGRHGVLTAPPVKELACEKGIAVWQPSSMRDGAALEILKSLSPDLCIVVAYGKILPADILSLPKYGCINIHASLLPKLRGAAPIQWSVINGFDETGVTSMQMDVGLDTGDMLIANKLAILPDETSGELHDRLAPLAAETLLQTLDALEKGELRPVKQNNAEFTYAPMLSKDMSAVCWNDSALTVHNRIRGLLPWPGATAKLAGRDIKIHRAVLSDYHGGKPGEIMCANKCLTVSCGDGKCVDILILQAQGKKPMPAADYLRGNPVSVGSLME